MPTPHNNAQNGDFAKTVLMPGDPLRAKFIAETFSGKPAACQQRPRVQGYTGTYKGVRVSVMASGMASCPSPSTPTSSTRSTAWKRTSSASAPRARCARTWSSAACVLAWVPAPTPALPTSMSWAGRTPICDFDLLMAAVESAKELGVKMPVGNLYSPTPSMTRRAATPVFGKMGILAVEMEAAGLTCTAATPASARLPPVPSPITSSPAGLSADERQTTFTNMMRSRSRSRSR